MYAGASERQTPAQHPLPLSKAGIQGRPPTPPVSLGRPHTPPVSLAGWPQKSKNEIP